MGQYCEIFEEGKSTPRFLHFPTAVGIKLCGSAVPNAWQYVDEAKKRWEGVGKMKIETGVMVMKDGKAWGKTYEDGEGTSYGWVDPENAPMHDPTFCTKPTDVTYQGSPYTAELSTGKIVHVKRVTEVMVLKNEPQEK